MWSGFTPHLSQEAAVLYPGRLRSKAGKVGELLLSESQENRGLQPGKAAPRDSASAELINKPALKKKFQELPRRAIFF